MCLPKQRAPLSMELIWPRSSLQATSNRLYYGKSCAAMYTLMMGIVLITALFPLKENTAKNYSDDVCQCDYVAINESKFK